MESIPSEIVKDACNMLTEATIEYIRFNKRVHATMLVAVLGVSYDIAYECIEAWITARTAKAINAVATKEDSNVAYMIKIYPRQEDISPLLPILDNYFRTGKLPGGTKG